MSVQAPNSNVNSSAKSAAASSWRRWIFPAFAFGPLLVAVAAGFWDQHDRMKRLDHIKAELDQLESRVKAVQRAVDERQKQGGEKQPGPKKVTPAASGQK
jgi:hypothetical protein